MMKKGFFTLLACVLLVSCNKMPDMKPTYTLTVTAGKADTKALNIDGSGALKATWSKGETVQVIWPGTGDVLGTLTAQGDGKSTTLSGTISGEFIGVGKTLRLEFLSANYTSQNGLLNEGDASIEKTCDYATAEVKILSIDGNTITTETASFTNRQAIMKFTLKQGGASFLTSGMSITVTGSKSITISVVPPSPTDELYVAIPCYYDSVFSFSFDALDLAGFMHYYKNIDSQTIENGKFYNVTLNL